MSNRPAIGIIGGMGPAAGFDLARKITTMTHAATDQDHLPVIVFSRPADIPDRTAFLLKHRTADPADAIARIARELEAAGATVAGIPCNTAHAPAIFRRVIETLAETGSQLKLLNMIEETVRHVIDTCEPHARIGILGTTGVRVTRLYAAPLEEAGFHALELDEGDHARLVMDALYSTSCGIKVISPPSPDARDRVLAAIDRLAAEGADAVILGCTELPLAVSEKSRAGGLPLVDPGDILARALIRETYPESLAPNRS